MSLCWGLWNWGIPFTSGASGLITLFVAATDAVDAAAATVATNVVYELQLSLLVSWLSWISTTKLDKHTRQNEFNFTHDERHQHTLTQSRVQLAFLHWCVAKNKYFDAGGIYGMQRRECQMYFFNESGRTILYYIVYRFIAYRSSNTHINYQLVCWSCMIVCKYITTPFLKKGEFKV